MTTSTTTSTTNVDVLSILKAVGNTPAAVDTISNTTGLSRNKIFALVSSIKKDGLGAYDKDSKTITLSAQGMALINPVAAVDTIVEQSEQIDVGSNSPTSIVEQTINKPQSAASTLPANTTAAKGKPGREANPMSKCKQFEAYMASYPYLRRSELIKAAVEQFGLTTQGAGTYIYNYNKRMKETGGVCVSGPNKPADPRLQTLVLPKMAAHATLGDTTSPTHATTMVSTHQEVEVEDEDDIVSQPTSIVEETTEIVEPS